MKLLIISTRFLMNASILKRGKVEIFENDGLNLSMVNFFNIQALLDKYDDEQLTLNILQLIGNVAEEPRARKFMCNNLGCIDKYLNHDFDLIKEQAKITKDIITWKP
jgi:hypothetical protein